MKIGIRTIHDAKRFSVEEMHEMWGKWGPELYEKLRGRSNSPLREEWTAKSIGEQETFMQDTRDPKFLRKELNELAQGVHKEFVKDGFKSFKGVTLTVRFADFTTLTRSTTLPEPEARLEALQFQALRLFMPFLDRRENPQNKAFRLLGVRVERLATVQSESGKIGK